jgi:hypothetical protein
MSGTEGSGKRGGYTYDSYGDVRRIREDKLHFLELLPPTPVLCEPYPASTAVAKAVSHDDGCSVTLYSGDDEGCWV